MLTAVMGVPVREQCDRGEHPHCAFIIVSDRSKRARRSPTRV